MCIHNNSNTMFKVNKKQIMLLVRRNIIFLQNKLVKYSKSKCREEAFLLAGLFGSYKSSVIHEFALKNNFFLYTKF